MGKPGYLDRLLGGASYNVAYRDGTLAGVGYGVGSLVGAAQAAQTYYATNFATGQSLYGLNRIGMGFSALSAASGAAAGAAALPDMLGYVNRTGNLVGASTVAQETSAARIAVPTGDTYSAAFQTELRTSSYPDILRPAHFQEANENLLQAMESDPQFAQQMQEAGVNLQRTPTGVAPRTSPVGWTWHHAPEPGVLQLVPRWQHTPGSIFWGTLHPGGQGGYAIWGQQ